MITLIHGDFTESSRKELTMIKDKAHGAEIRVIDGKSLDESKLTQALESQSLFGLQTIVIIEQLFGGLGRKLKLIEKLAGKIAESAQSTDIVLWESREMGKTVISSLGKTVKLSLHKTPSVIFQFLDALQPGNAKQVLTLYQSALKIDAPELIHSMIVKRVRQLIMLSEHVTPDGIQPWQISRLTTQGRHFTLEQLISLHTKLRDAEYAVKSGLAVQPLGQLLINVFIDL